MSKKIKEDINLGYDEIFCVVDMDNKQKGVAKQDYYALKQKYLEPINMPRKGILCRVKFFESHPCTELFFLYYFE